MSKGRLAIFVRARRDSLGMTQAQVAERAGWSKSAIEKVEAGTLVPSLEFAGALFDTLAVPYLYRERIIAALYPGALAHILGRTSTVPDADDLADLEFLPYPAAYLMLPECTVLGANSAWAEAFPGSARTPNLLHYLFTEPVAWTALPEWERLAHTLTYGIRMMGPIVLPESTYAEIIDGCRSHPEFERLYTTDPAVHAPMQPLLEITHPVTGETRTVCLRIDKPHLPHSPWVTYRLVPARDEAVGDPPRV